MYNYIYIHILMHVDRGTYVSNQRALCDVLSSSIDYSCGVPLYPEIATVYPWMDDASNYTDKHTHIFIYKYCIYIITYIYIYTYAFTQMYNLLNWQNKQDKQHTEPQWHPRTYFRKKNDEKTLIVPHIPSYSKENHFFSALSLLLPASGASLRSSRSCAPSYAPVAAMPFLRRRRQAASSRRRSRSLAKPRDYANIPIVERDFSEARIQWRKRGSSRRTGIWQSKTGTGMSINVPPKGPQPWGISPGEMGPRCDWNFANKIWGYLGIQNGLNNKKR